MKEEENLFKIVPEDLPVHKINRSIWVLSIHEEEFEVPGVDPYAARNTLKGCINNEEYVKFKHTSNLVKAIPYIKNVPNVSK